MDEAGFSFSQNNRKTYAPAGRTPEISDGGKYGGVSAAGLIAEDGRLFHRLSPVAFTGEAIEAFLRDAAAFLGHKLLLIWDNARIHSHGPADKFAGGPWRLDKPVHAEPLPPYCPELNADEQVHGYIKKNLLANRLFKKMEELIEKVELGYQFLKNSPDLVLSFFNNKNVGFSQQPPPSQ